MIASNLAWSIDPKALVKSMYSKYMSCVVNLASSSTTISVYICLLVHLSYLKPS